MASLAVMGLGWCAETAAQPVQRLAIEGNHAVGSAAIRERLALALPAPADSALLETAAGRLLALYAERGYLRARVTAAYDPSPDGARELRLTISEGERTRLGKLALAGCAGLPAERVEGELGLRPGRGVSAPALREGIERVLRLYEEEGYPFVEVGPETLSLDGEGGDLSLALRVREGSRVRVRDLAVAGNRVTRARTIEREMRFRPGEVYRQSRLDRGRERLQRSGLFLQVGDLGLRPSASGREVTVELDVVEGPTNTLEAGLGYVPPRGGAGDGYLTGKVDLRLANLAGTGRSAEVHWRRLGPGSASWRLAYREPWVAGLPFALGGELRQVVRDSTYTTRGVSLEAALPLSPELDWELAAVGERTTTGARGFGYEETSRRAGAAAGFLYDRRDAVWSPRRGGFGRAQVGWARRTITRLAPEDTTLATTERVAEATIELAAGLYLPTGPERVLTFEGTWQEIVSHGLEVPVYRLYFLGGADGPRGYAEDQFAGARAGRASLEYRFLLGARSRFHFFLDLGYDEWKGDADLHWGYGTGVRLESRLGLLGLDLGFPLGESLGEAKIHLRLAEEW